MAAAAQGHVVTSNIMHRQSFRICLLKLILQSVLQEPVPGSRRVRCLIAISSPAENLEHCERRVFVHVSEHISAVTHAQEPGFKG